MKIPPPPVKPRFTATPTDTVVTKPSLAPVAYWANGRVLARVNRYGR